MAGGGAAWAVRGIAAAVFLNADIKPGIEIVLNAVNLAQAAGCSTVITGEGASTRKRQAESAAGCGIGGEAVIVP